jgi:hypothetical protein
MKLLKALGVAALATFVFFLAVILVASFVAFLKTIVGSFFAFVGGLFLIIFICVTAAVYENS